MDTYIQVKLINKDSYGYVFLLLIVVTEMYVSNKKYQYICYQPISFFFATM